MKTTNKKLQLKKETMAVLNDKSLFAINGGNDQEEDGDSIVTTTIISITVTVDSMEFTPGCYSYDCNTKRPGHQDSCGLCGTKYRCDF